MRKMLAVAIAGILICLPRSVSAVEPAASPSVLLLPPRLSAGAGDSVRAAAEAVCDRLAQDIAAMGLARTVDRTQLDRIIQERRLQTDPARPMLSYDVMIRLEVDTVRLTPQLMLSLVDLSTGNILAQRAFDWPPKEAAARSMLDFCREALKGVTKPVAGKLRVRTLWAADAIDNERMRPLAKRLIEVFDKALQRSERVVPVRHLEAADAKEESLLLLMGLSRLPGKRQFAPQADATIELRVIEADGRGKTFPETPIEIGVRLRKGNQYQGDWVTTTGLVRDFDTLIPRAWQRLAQSLSDVRPETAATLLSEMDLRRKQAEAELRIANNLQAVADQNLVPELEAGLAALPHTEAAVKLDPTFPDAAAAHVKALGIIRDYDWKEPRQMPDAPRRALREAARYVERFRDDGKVCGTLCRDAVLSVYHLPSKALFVIRDNNELLIPVEKDSLRLTADLVQDLEAVRQLLERSLERDVSLIFDDYTRMTVGTYRGMRLLGVPAAERQTWLEAVGRRCGEKLKAKVPNPIQSLDAEDWRQCTHLRLRVVELLIEDEQVDAAKRILLQMQSDLPNERWSAAYSSIPLMGAVVAKIGDAQLLAEYQKWRERIERQSTRRISIESPRIDLFAGKEDLDATNLGRGLAPLDIVEIRTGPPAGDNYRAPGRYRPLAEGDGRLYFVMLHSREVIAYVPLDEKHRPIGTALHDARWDHIESIPQPRLGNESKVTSARYIDSKLYLGTTHSGLHVFDPKDGIWTVYGPEQGLPSSTVLEFFPIGGRLLYCNSGDSQYTLNIGSGTVTLVHPAPPPCHRVNRHLWLVWRDGSRLRGIDDSGCGILTDLLDTNPARSALCATCYGWPRDPYDGTINGAVEAEGRHFCLSRGGLHEIDAAGKNVRTWWGYFRSNLGNAGAGMFLPADSPLPGMPQRILASGSRLLFEDGRTLSVYDWKTDTWYGPINNPSIESSLITANGGLWGTLSSESLCYLSLDNILAYARSVGRVMTTAEYRQRVQQSIDVAKPLDRAKFAIGMRQFDKAKAAFHQVLDTQPNHPEALILMGYLHDRDCLNQPDKAIKYYRRAAELANHPPASYSGMYLWTCILQDRGQWQESIDLCEKILHRFPELDERERERTEQIRDHSRQQLAEKDAKRPAAEPSNKEEGRKP